MFCHVLLVILPGSDGALIGDSRILIGFWLVHLGCFCGESSNDDVVFAEGCLGFPGPLSIGTFTGWGGGLGGLYAHNKDLRRPI